MTVYRKDAANDDFYLGPTEKGLMNVKIVIKPIRFCAQGHHLFFFKQTEKKNDKIQTTTNGFESCHGNGHERR